MIRGVLSAITLALFASPAMSQAAVDLASSPEASNYSRCMTMGAGRVAPYWKGDADSLLTSAIDDCAPERHALRDSLGSNGAPEFEDFDQAVVQNTRQVIKDRLQLFTTSNN